MDDQSEAPVGHAGSPRADCPERTVVAHIDRHVIVEIFHEHMVDIKRPLAVERGALLLVSATIESGIASPRTVRET